MNNEIHETIIIKLKIAVYDPFGLVGELSKTKFVNGNKKINFKKRTF